MKNRIFLLGTLIVLATMSAVSSAYAQRGRFGGGGRVSVGPGVSRRIVSSPHVSTRIGVGVGYGRWGGYYRPPVRYYGGHYYRSGYYYRPYRYYGPPIGFRVGILPYGFLTFNTGWGPYYYYDGFFYRPYANTQTQTEQYEVVDPPMGVVVPALPSGAKTVVIDGNTYYEKNGTFYQEVLQDKQTKYAVVGKNGELNTGSGQDNQGDPSAPPADEIMATLPEGSRGVEINGQQLYVSPDGMYYQEVTNADNSRGYKIVGKMSADN
ncbi:DUF6515 family protein [Chitinophaga agri]|uniref:Uncharacterized protein n=1 Tax=Chitinophaga agri TaxID=2703787 RepID=A0A6B9ZNT1_9BACT|nr:DUF6515 family protein [Chitinophaga agri]QHS62293.1 hypothetical protein GWR21_22720 [Chitinophaga agri]